MRPMVMWNGTELMTVMGSWGSSGQGTSEELRKMCLDMACSIWLRTLTLGSELLSCTGQRLLQGVLIVWASRCAEGKVVIDSQDFSEDATREKQCSWGRGWVLKASAVWAAIAGWRFRKHHEIVGWDAKLQHGLLHYCTSGRPCLEVGIIASPPVSPAE